MLNIVVAFTPLVVIALISVVRIFQGEVIYGVRVICADLALVYIALMAFHTN
jgi:hypothetical protein